MRIAVVGTIVKDKIREFDGNEVQSLGGLMHTVHALKSVVEPDDTIIPISFIGNDLTEEFYAQYGNDENIDLEGLQPLNQPNNCVELIYQSESERHERSLYPMPPLKGEHILPLLNEGIDLLIVNMISGWDTDIETMEAVRRKYTGPIAMDLHSLCLQREESGERFSRTWFDADRWINCVNIVQINEKESKIISSASSSFEEFCVPYCFNHDKIFNLTVSERGSISYFKNGSYVTNMPVRPPDNLNVVDPTGCGDAFLAVFSYMYNKHNDIRKSAEKANQIAAFAGTFTGLPSVDALRKLQQER